MKTGIDTTTDMHLRIMDLERELAAVTAERDRYKAALQRLADCYCVISLPDRMDPVRLIARDALRGEGVRGE